MKYLLKHDGSPINGKIILEGSKSISNRALMIRALSGKDFPIDNLSVSADTRTMEQLLKASGPEFNAGHAGTVFRFMTAFLCIKDGEHLLTGSERMKQRPIGVLVDALRKIGADISYTEKEGYPPLRIKGGSPEGGEIKIAANISSQYISALLMLAPLLPEGLQLQLEGKISSRPYIMLTLEMLSYFGIDWDFTDNLITVHRQEYKSAAFRVEADWSAASYYYSICALAQGSRIELEGLHHNSWQGDSVLPEIFASIGVKSIYTPNGLILENIPITAGHLRYDFSDCPDLAQTVITCCAGLGMHGHFTGLESLRIKETDRIFALQEELRKFGSNFKFRSGQWVLRPGEKPEEELPEIKTYEDHRMAMSFAPMALKKGALIIEDPLVVGKSYPSFWEDLGRLGFEVEKSPPFKGGPGVRQRTRRQG